MRVMAFVDSLAACVASSSGDERDATYKMALAIFSLLVAMDLERGRHGR